MIEKLNRTGSLHDDSDAKTGAPVTVRTEDNIQRVREYYTNNPTQSQRRGSEELNIDRTALRKMMKEDLQLFPYKIQLVQAFGKDSLDQRWRFANDIVGRIDRQELNPKVIWFSDECHFDLIGYVNKQNYRHWGTEKPFLTIAKPLHPQRITVWCAISSQRIIGPIFLDTTVTGAVYKAQILDNFIDKAARHGMLRNYWFQQDGARPHRTQEVFDRLKEVFGSRIIGLDAPRMTGDGIEWPPYSPDLNVCDFFLWGYIKDKVYKTSPQNIQELNNNITQVIRSIEIPVLERATKAFETRLRHLIVSQGEHFENLVQ